MIYCYIAGIIRFADHIIGIDPEGDTGGGMTVATGSPKRVAIFGKGFTAEFLRS